MRKHSPKKERILTLPPKTKNMVTGTKIIQSLGALQDFAQARINATRAVPVLLALSDVQRVRDAVVKALQDAPEADKQKVLDTEVELNFGPFMLEGLFADGTISPGSLLLLDGWFICVRPPEAPENAIPEKATPAGA
jgi:hypothetical protein